MPNVSEYARGFDAVDSMRMVASQWNPAVPYQAPPRVDGTIWSAIAVAGHWLFGGGVPLTVELRGLRLKLNLRQIGEVSKGTSLSLFVMNNNQPGVYNYDSGPYGYSAYGDSLSASLIVGNLSLRTKGTLVRNNDYSWFFYGSTAAYDDYFDFERRSDRPFWAETTSTLARSLNMGKSFTVKIEGTQDTYFEDKQ